MLGEYDGCRYAKDLRSVNRLSAAIRAIQQSADRTVVNQVWYFLDSPADLVHLLRLRGIEPPPEPLTDPFITFRIRDSFAPIPLCYIEALEASLNASLPIDYKTILMKFGPIHLPAGNHAVALIDPSTICRSLLAYGARPWNAPFLPIAYYTGEPNAIGLLRDTGNYLPGIYRMNHEQTNRSESDIPDFHSIADFIVHQLSQNA